MVAGMPMLGDDGCAVTCMCFWGFLAAAH
jgi:hypothetical protein